MGFDLGEAAEEVALRVTVILSSMLHLLLSVKLNVDSHADQG